MAQPRKLFRYERLSGLLMLSAMAAALVAANSPLKPIYDLVHHTPIHVRLGPLMIDRPLVDWINEGLMVFFFLLIGLEIKRQFIEGHLSSPKCAVLPAFAALGGIIVPAAIYLIVNRGDPIVVGGWPIPTATDIVLALGVLALLGSRVPDGLKVFLTALAIFDDIAAVLFIGLLYGENFHLAPMVPLALGLAGLVLLNRMRITWPIAYIVIGVVLWVAALESGLEAALVGAVIALAVPMHSSDCPCSSPVRNAELRFYPWSVLFVVPVFAFFNAGVTINGDAIAHLAGPVSLGIVGGLFFGKQLGVFVVAWAAVRLGIGKLPDDVSWPQLYGVALLAGIGFTMSLFVATLAFPNPVMQDSAKLAILVGSLASGLLGLLWLSIISSPRSLEATAF